MDTTLRILIVEDSESDAGLIILDLERAGYITFHERVETAAEMKAAMERQDWDVIISDYSMPMFNAFAALRIVQESGLDIPFIVVSGAMGEDTAVAMMKAGAHDYVMKGKLARLAPAVKRELGDVEVRRRRKRAEEALRESEQNLHDIIDFLPDATYVIDQNGKVIAWNRAIEEMTGVKASDILGKGDYEYAIPFHGRRRPLLIDLVFLSTLELKEKYPSVKKEGDVLIAEADVPVRGGNPRTLWGIARPLYDSKGKTVGAIESIRDVSERKQMEETVKWLAFHDGLTGLPNRRLFIDRLAMALEHVRRNRGKLSVLILDLDKFKLINDTLGHPVGDSLLRAVGERLTIILRKEDTVARIGGDEFMLLLPEINSENDVVIFAERILQAFQQPFQADGHELHVTTSIGFAIYPDDGADADTLIKNADIALFVAKEQGRNRYQRFMAA